MIVVRRGRPRDLVRRASELDEVYRALMSPRGAVTTRSTGTWRPPLDVYEQPDSVTIIAELAGMDREEIEVLIEGDLVSLRGTRPDPNVCNHRAFHEAHIAYGAFAADIYIPYTIDNDRATATYENGFLRIELPRVKGRTIVPTVPDGLDRNERSDA